MATKKTQTKQVKPKTKTSSKAASLQRIIFNAKTKFQDHQIVYSVLATLLVVVILTATTFFIRKDLFIAANINGKIVTTPEFYTTMLQASGEASFEAMVRDTLIEQEAEKNGISASSEEIDKKIGEIEGRFGGTEGLDQVLSMNNTSREQFQDQIVTQILVEKLFEEEIKVSNSEVDKYIKENKEQTKGLSKEEVREQLKSQKLNEHFTTWFEEIKENSSIEKFF